MRSMLASLFLLLCVHGLVAPCLGQSPQQDAQRRHDEQNWKDAYNTGYKGRSPTPNLAFLNRPGYKKVYFSGYAAGKSKRENEERALRLEEEAKEREEQSLLALYGTAEYVGNYRDGVRDGSGGKGLDPPPQDDPSAYIAYMEGYLKANHGAGGSFAPSLPDDTRLLARLFTEQLNGMAQQSQQYYLLLDATNAEFRLDVDANPSLSDSIARTREAIAIAKRAMTTHVKLNQHATAAARIQPRLVAALNAHATSLLRDIATTEFEEFRKNLHAKADELAAEARRLSDEPVSLPGDFEKMGRYHRESIIVMGKALEADSIRQTLSSGADDPAAVLAGMREYVEFCRSWQEGQLLEWQDSRLKRMYRAVGAQFPGDFDEEAGPEPGRAVPQEPEPEQARVVMAMTKGGEWVEKTASGVLQDPVPPSDPLSRFGLLKRIATWAGLFIGGVFILSLLCTVFGNS